MRFREKISFEGPAARPSSHRPLTRGGEENDSPIVRPGWEIKQLIVHP